MGNRARFTRIDGVALLISLKDVFEIERHPAIMAQRGRQSRALHVLPASPNERYRTFLWTREHPFSGYYIIESPEEALSKLIAAELGGGE